MRISRRDFVRAGATVGLGAGASPRALAQGPTIVMSRIVKPVVIASANGNFYKNGGEVTAVEKAFSTIVGGARYSDPPIQEGSSSNRACVFLWQ